MLFAKDLNIMWDNNSVFQDISMELNEYGRDTKVIDLSASQDYLYIGLYKPFSAIYAELKVVNSVANTLTAEYWNGTSWVALSNFLDLSKGLTRSGFLSWSKDSSWTSNSVNSTTLYWIRLRPSSDLSGTTELQGLNIVYADDQDLVNEFSRVNDYKATAQLSYINYHQSVRDDIVQQLRNSGKFKKDASLNDLDITKWDFLQQEQIKKAAIYLCLSKIFFELSDSIEDKWYQRSKDYHDKGNAALQVYYLNIDLNDDGIEQDGEKLQDQNIDLFRA